MSFSIDIREEAGVRTLHFSSEWVQPRSPHEAQRNAGQNPITATLLPGFHFVASGLHI